MGYKMVEDEPMRPEDRLSGCVKEMASCSEVLGAESVESDNAWFIALGYLYALLDLGSIDECDYNELRNRVSAIAHVAADKDDYSADCNSFKRRLEWILKEKKHEAQTD